MKEAGKQRVIAYLDKAYQEYYKKLHDDAGLVDCCAITVLALITRIKIFIISEVE